MGVMRAAAAARLGLLAYAQPVVAPSSNSLRLGDMGAAEEELERFRSMLAAVRPREGWEAEDELPMGCVSKQALHLRLLLRKAAVGGQLLCAVEKSLKRLNFLGLLLACRTRLNFRRGF